MSEGEAGVELEQKLTYVLELADRLGLKVRLERLGGEGGGTCRLHGKVMVFIDLDADVETQYGAALSGLRTCGDLDGQFILPEVRSDLENPNHGEGFG